MHSLVCLCMPCAGVCSAVYIMRFNKPREDKHRRLGWRGLFSNIFMGDFVEACYPYTLSSPLMLTAIRVSCAMAGAVLAYGGFVRSTAYLPLPVSLLLADSGWMSGGAQGSIITHPEVIILGTASLIAFIVPLLVSIVYLDKPLRTEPGS